MVQFGAEVIPRLTSKPTEPSTGRVRRHGAIQTFVTGEAAAALCPIILALAGAAIVGRAPIKPRQIIRANEIVAVFMVLPV